MLINKLEAQEIQSLIKGVVLFNESMSKHTYYGIGGPARSYIIPEDREDLSKIIVYSMERNIKTYFLGSGSNILVNDKGLNGIVITPIRSLNKLRINGEKVFAESGLMLGKLVLETIKKNLTGLESLSGVPGTLGGAIKMNAGAYGQEISNYLYSIEVMNKYGLINNLSKNDIQFNYRSSSFKSDYFILSSKFKLEKSESLSIKKIKKSASIDRRKSQPLRFRSAGSVFKNPPSGPPAGYLIDQSGLKGYKKGDAQISEKHANFFINHGKATSDDIIYLIKKAKNEVNKKFGIILELEIKILGYTDFKEFIND